MGSRLCFKATFLRRVDGLALGTGDRWAGQSLQNVVSYKQGREDGYLAQGHSGQHKLTEVKEGMAARLCKGIFTAKVSRSPQCPP